MKACLILVVLNFTLFLTSCSKPKIIGKWKREGQTNLELGIKSSKGGWGDITFRSDSTFLISGKEREGSTGVSVPGWHAGEEIKGKWWIESNHLLLKPETLEINLYLKYKIIQLTSRKLVLASSLEESANPAEFLNYYRE